MRVSVNSPIPSKKKEKNKHAHVATQDWIETLTGSQSRARFSRRVL